MAAALPFFDGREPEPPDNGSNESLLYRSTDPASRAPVPDAAVVASTLGETRWQHTSPSSAAYLTLVERLRTRAPQDSADLAQGILDVFTQAGYVPNLDVDESDTVALTHPLGDANDDGADDVLLDVWCVGESCKGIPGALDVTPPCQIPHWIEARSGRDGTVLWQQTLDGHQDRSSPLRPEGTNLPRCLIEFVMGTYPDPEGHYDPLIYLWETAYHWRCEQNAFQLIHNDLRLLDAASGQAQWHYGEDGFHVYPDGCVYRAELFAGQNVLLWPHLQVPPDEGVSLVANDTRPNLWVRSIGYQAGMTGYEPWEWAARLDPSTGQEVWRIHPFPVEVDRGIGDFVVPFTFPNTYWGPGCCWDLTGDDEPDLFYLVIHFTNAFNARLLAYDGATGALLFDVYTHRNMPRPFATWVRPTGDVQGDGKDDFAQIAVESGPNVSLTLRNGPDASPLWRDVGPNLPFVLPIGDATGDGGHELFVAPFSLESFRDDSLFTNLTQMPFLVREGGTGRVLWNATTHTAPSDFLAYLGILEAHRPQDLTGDGVAELWTDELHPLPDLTVVHELRALDGRDGHEHLRVPAVGGFGYPWGTADLDGDGRNDFVLLQGDVVDLWMSAHRGHDAHPLWSRRVLTAPVADATWKIPFPRWQPLDYDREHPGSDLAMTTFLYVQTRGVRSWYNQNTGIGGTNGTHHWSYPLLEFSDDSLLLNAYPPAVQRFTPPEFPPSKGSLLTWVGPATGSGAIAFGIGLLGFQLFTRRRLRGGGPKRENPR